MDGLQVQRWIVVIAYPINPNMRAHFGPRTLSVYELISRSTYVAFIIYYLSTDLRQLCRNTTERHIFHHFYVKCILYSSWVGMLCTIIKMYVNTFRPYETCLNIVVGLGDCLL